MSYECDQPSNGYKYKPKGNELKRQRDAAIAAISADYGSDSDSDDGKDVANESSSSDEGDYPTVAALKIASLGTDIEDQLYTLEIPVQASPCPRATAVYDGWSNSAEDDGLYLGAATVDIEPEVPISAPIVETLEEPEKASSEEKIGIEPEISDMELYERYRSIPYEQFLELGYKPKKIGALLSPLEVDHFTRLEDKRSRVNRGKKLANRLWMSLEASSGLSREERGMYESYKNKIATNANHDLVNWLRRENPDPANLLLKDPKTEQ